MNTPMIRTTVTLPEDLLFTIKKRALKEKRTMNEIVVESIQFNVLGKQTSSQVASKLPPSKTAGTIQMSKSMPIEKVFDAIKNPYDKKSIFGR